MAEDQAAPDEGQGAVLLARLLDRLQRPDRRRPAEGHRRDPRRPEGLGHDGPPALPRRHGHQQPASPSTRTRPAGPASGAWRWASRSAPATCSRRPSRRKSFSDLTGERGVLMGAIYGLWLAQYEVLRATRPLAERGVQRDGGGGDAEPLPADRREGHGLDVRELLDDRPARRARLVHGVPRRVQAGVREAVPVGREPARRRGATLEANSRPDYRQQLEKELKAIAESEMWQAGRRCGRCGRNGRGS